MSKVLVIKMTALGDVVAALAHLEQICRHYAKDEVWLLTSPEARGLFEHHPSFKVRTMNRDSYFSQDGRIATVRWVRSMKFDRIFDLQGNKVSYGLCKWSRCPERLGTQPNPAYTKSVDTKWERTTKDNVAQRLDRTLACGGVAPPIEPGPLYCSQQDQDAVEAFTEKHGLGQKPYAVFHGGSSPEWITKRWPVEYIAQLVDMLDGQGIACILAGSPVEKEINATITANKGIDATGAVTFRQLFLLARGARFAVSNDSAPMHLFSQAGIPVFAFFGPTNRKWSHGFNQTENVITASVSCSPCFKTRCPADKGHACMRNLTPELVFGRIMKTIGEGGQES